MTSSGSVSNRVNMFENSASRNSSGASASSSKRLAIIARKRSKQLAAPVNDNRDDVSGQAKPSAGLDQDRSSVDWPGKDEDTQSVTRQTTLEPPVDPPMEPQTPRLSNTVGRNDSMTSATVAETCTFDSSTRDENKSVAWPDDQSEGPLCSNSTLSSNSSKEKMSNRFSKIRSQQAATRASNNGKLSSRLSKLKSNAHRRTLSANSIATKPSEDDLTADTNIGLKRSLEDASVVMEEERASTVASSTSSLSCDELTSIAKRALQVAREKENPSMKAAPVDDRNLVSASASIKARLAKTKHISAATRRRFENSNCDDNASVASTGSSKYSQSLSKTTFDDSTFESYDEASLERSPTKSRPCPPVGVPRNVQTTIASNEVVTQSASAVRPRRALLMAAAERTMAAAERTRTASPFLNDHSYRNNPTAKKQEPASNPPDADDDSTIGSGSFKSARSAKLAAAPSRDDTIGSNSTGGRRRLNAFEKANKRREKKQGHAPDPDDDSTIGSRSTKSGRSAAPSRDDNTISSNSTDGRSRLNAFEKASKRRQEYLELTHNIQESDDNTLGSKVSIDSEGTGMTKALNAVLSTEPRPAMLPSAPKPKKLSIHRSSCAASPSRAGRLSGHPALRGRASRDGEEEKSVNREVTKPSIEEWNPRTSRDKEEKTSVEQEVTKPSVGEWHPETEVIAVASERAPIRTRVVITSTSPRTPKTQEAEIYSFNDQDSVDPFDAADGDSVASVMADIAGDDEDSRSAPVVAEIYSPCHRDPFESLRDSPVNAVHRKPVDAESTLTADPFEEILAEPKIDPDGAKPPTLSDTSHNLLINPFRVNQAKPTTASFISTPSSAGQHHASKMAEDDASEIITVHREDPSITSTLSKSSAETSLPSHLFRSHSESTRSGIKSKASNGEDASITRTRSKSSESSRSGTKSKRSNKTFSNTPLPEHETVNFDENEERQSENGLAGLDMDSRHPPSAPYQSDCSTMMYSQKTDNDSTLMGGKFVLSSSEDMTNPPSLDRSSSFGPSEVQSNGLLGKLENRSREESDLEVSTELDTLFTTCPDTTPANATNDENESSAPAALEWWDQNYAGDQEESLNEMVRNALSPTSKMPSNLFNRVDHESKGDDESLFSGLDNTCISAAKKDASPSNYVSMFPRNGTKEFSDSENSSKPPQALRSAPPPPPPRQEQLGQLLDESKLVNTVNSDITSSVIGDLMMKETDAPRRLSSLNKAKARAIARRESVTSEQVASPTTSKNSRMEIHQEIATISESTTDDERIETEPELEEEPISNIFLKLSNSVLDSFANICRVPVDNRVPRAPAEVDPENSIVARPEPSNHVSSNTSTVSGSSQSTMNEVETKKWDEWDRRDTISIMKKDAAKKAAGDRSDAIHVGKTKDSRSPRKTNKLPQVSEQSESLEAGVSSNDDMLNPVSQADAIRRQKPPRPLSLSINQRRILEKFTQNLERHSVEVLKQNRDSKWQVRYLTVCKERTEIKNVKLNYKHSNANDCPVAILWLKRFVDGKDYSTSLIDKQGRGGVMFADLVKVTATGKSDPVHPLPKKYQERYRESVTVIIEYMLNGHVRSMALRCKTTDEAHFLCTGLRVTMDIMKREKL